MKAFATYLCNDVFIPGAVALINSLKHHKTEHSIICMVTDGVTEEGRKTLENNGFLLENIEKIIPNRVEGIKDRYKDNEEDRQNKWESALKGNSFHNMFTK